MTKEHKFKAGVLIIGSLYWDNTKGRRPWRELFFGENFYQHAIKVPVPIRYGRFSTLRDCPTMVLSSEYQKEEKFGQGIFLPFKNQKQSVDDIIYSAKALSEAEGRDDNYFVKGNWCTLLYYLNPFMAKDKKAIFERYWKKNYNVSIC